MSRLMDAWNTEIEEEKKPKTAEPQTVSSPVIEVPPVEPVVKKKMGRPSATLDRSKIIKNVTVKMTANDFIYCNMLSKEMNEQGLCGGDVSSLIAYLIKQSRALNPELSEAAEAIYKLQTTRRKN